MFRLTETRRVTNPASEPSLLFAFTWSLRTVGSRKSFFHRASAASSDSPWNHGGKHRHNMFNIYNILYTIQLAELHGCLAPAVMAVTRRMQCHFRSQAA